jgi:CBS domain containing-hemolysin-like protein
MSLSLSLLTIAVLIVVSAFFSVAEISLAASRRLRLRQMADAGDPRAERVLRMQDRPGPYFTVVQIGLNAVAILGGVVGEGALSPYFNQVFLWVVAEPTAGHLSFIASFACVISLFIVFADLLPKRLGMSAPEQVAIRLAGSMETLLWVLKPVVWLFGRVTDMLIRVLGLPTQRDDRITSDDILAMTEAGARSGLLAEREHEVIANVFELDTRLVTSAMTPRERIAWFHKDDPDAVIRARILAEPFSTYPVCDGTLDHVLGYVDAKDLFQRVLNNQPLSCTGEGLLHKVQVVPDRLSLAEVLEQFRQAHEDFALIVNEYSFVVGVITLNDVMSTVMGGLVDPQDEDWIVQRDDHSWLIDGMTPMVDVQRTLEIAELPNEGQQYETLAGFLMEILRRVPKRTDSVTWAGLRFEVMDVDSYRIDQVMVTRQPVDPLN